MQDQILCLNSWFVIARRANVRRMPANVDESVFAAQIFVDAKVVKMWKTALMNRKMKLLKKDDDDDDDDISVLEEDSDDMDSYF